MNRRQFFQSVVAVTVAPEVKPPMLGFSKFYRGARLEQAVINKVTGELLKSRRRIYYFDTDGVVLSG